MMSTRPRPVTRRYFLQAAGQTAAAIGASQDLSGAAPASIAAEAPLPPVAAFGKVFQPLKLDFRQSAEVTAEAGLNGVDCAVRPGGEIAPQQAAEQMPRYAEALARYKLRMLLLSTGIQGVDSPHAHEILAAGKQLGIRYYRLGFWLHRPGEPAEKLLGEIRARLKELAAMNRDLGMCALVQNHSPWNSNGKGPVGGDLNELHGLVKDFDPREIAVAFDLGHAIIVHQDEWRVQYEKLAPHIRVVYVKDVQRPSRFVPFGQGEFGRSGFFPMLARTNYCAPLSMHMEYEWAPKGQQTRAGLVAALKANRRVLRQWWKGA